MAGKKPKDAYADTTVTVAKSRSEMQRLLESHGIRTVQITSNGDATAVRFQFEWETVKHTVRLVVDPERQGQPYPRSSQRTRQAHQEREARRLHRVLFFWVKSQLEAIATGLLSPVEIWLPQIEAGERTVYEQLTAHREALNVPGANLPSILALPPARTP
jgi:hypothetical protein